MPVLFIAAFFGSIYGVWLMRAGSGDGKTAVAFGSFLAPAACVMMFVGQPLLAWYLGTMPR
jgi:prepilin signal peptidase PulO-like enzyme (type II secretory pathway)